jgi:uncharacterized protein YutE (UPF0331/DUF86 family)
MANQAILDGKFHNLRRYLQALQQATGCTEAEFLNDQTRIGAARYYMLVAIECCLDIGNHIISADGLRTPKDYRDVFSVLQENNIIPAGFLPVLHHMVGLRNLLVHDYETIDDQRIYLLATTRLEDFNVFVAAIQEYVGPRS